MFTSKFTKSKASWQAIQDLQSTLRAATRVRYYSGHQVIVYACHTSVSRTRVNFKLCAVLPSQENDHMTGGKLANITSLVSQVLTGKTNNLCWIPRDQDLGCVAQTLHEITGLLFQVEWL